MIIAIDFDGTLHTGQWPEIGAPAPYAVEVMKRLKADGHYLIIWTCRENETQTAMVNWLLEKGIPFDRINDNSADNTKRFGGNARKVNADVYIDDKQVGGLPMWGEIYDYVNEKEADIKKHKQHESNSKMEKY
jgi:hypothetical protein